MGVVKILYIIKQYLTQMSTHSELPELHVNQYSVERVGEEVIWPLVDYKWEDDWRKHAFVSERPMQLPRRGVMPQDIEARGRVLTTENVDAILLASCVAEPMIDDDGEVDEFSREVALASLVVELHVDSDPKENMLNRATREVEALDSREGDVADGDQDEYESYCRDINDFDDLGELSAVISTEFGFDDENMLQVQRRQELRAPDGYVVWRPRVTVEKDNPEASTPVYMPTTFNEADMDLLESGLRVFRAPKAILRALEKIRQQPL